MEIPPGVRPGDTFLVEVAGADEAQQQAQMQLQQLSQGSSRSDHSSGHNTSTGVLGDASQLLGMSGYSGLSAPSVGGDGAPPLSPEDAQHLSFALSCDLDSSSVSPTASSFQNHSAGSAPVAYEGMIGLHTVFEYAEGGTPQIRATSYISECRS